MKRRLKIKFVEEPTIEPTISLRRLPEPIGTPPFRVVLMLHPDGHMMRQVEARAQTRKHVEPLNR